MKSFSLKKILLTFLVFVIIIVSHFIGILRPLENVVFIITEPVASVFYSASRNINNWLNVFKDPNILFNKNKELERENANLQEKLKNAEVKIRENEHLKLVLKYEDNLIWQSKLAKISGFFDVAGESIMIINQGTNSGIKIGNLVTTETNVLLGEIIEVGNNFSKVRLITHPDFQIAVKKIDDTRVLGILKGNFSLSLIVELIPISSDLKFGDELVTANLQNKPSDIRIGKIESVEQLGGELFKKAVVTPLFNLDNVMFVKVIVQSD